MPLSRFELHVILRNQLGDRAAVRRALAIEAVMEDFAVEVGADVVTWAIAGLGADIDCKLAANPARRGVVAEEILLAEGAAPEVARAARDRWHAADEEIDLLPAAIVVAAAMVDDAFGSEESAPAARVLACASRLKITLGRANELALAAMDRIREDLQR
jgi:predicted hydrolase (HD superfamily)